MNLGSPIFCERCGVETHLLPPGATQFCLGCRLYLCGACYPGITVRCADCAWSRTNQARAYVGLGAARDALHVAEVALAAVDRMREHQRLSLRGVRAVPNPVRATDVAFEQLKVAGALKAADFALGHIRPRYEHKAEALRRELALMRERADDPFVDSSEAAARPTLEERAGRVERRTTEKSTNRFARRVRHRAAELLVGRRTVLVAGVVAALIVGVAAALAQSHDGATRSGPFDPGAGLPASRAPAGAVAGSQGSPAPHATPQAASPLDRVTFDDLEIGSPIAAGWLVEGQPESFAVVAYPTAVNRSLRLRGVGSSVAACHELSLDVTEFTLGLTFMVDPGSRPDARITIVFDGGKVEFRASGGPSDEESPGESATFPGILPETWYRADVEISDSSALARVSSARAGPTVGATDVARSDAAAIQRICFSIQNGDPVELYLDELVIYS